MEDQREEGVKTDFQVFLLYDQMHHGAICCVSTTWNRVRFQEEEHVFSLVHGGTFKETPLRRRVVRKIFKYMGLELIEAWVAGVYVSPWWTAFT